VSSVSESVSVNHFLETTGYLPSYDPNRIIARPSIDAILENNVPINLDSNLEPSMCDDFILVA
jgi:hypothetical protein